MSLTFVQPLQVFSVVETRPDGPPDTKVVRTPEAALSAVVSLLSEWRNHSMVQSQVDDLVAEAARRMHWMLTRSGAQWSIEDADGERFHIQVTMHTL